MFATNAPYGTYSGRLTIRVGSGATVGSGTVVSALCGQNYLSGSVDAVIVAYRAGGILLDFAPVAADGFDPARNTGSVRAAFADGVTPVYTPLGDFSGDGKTDLRDVLCALRAVEAGTAPRMPQDESRVSYAPMLSKELSPIDWNREPRAILKQIYGLQDWPCATAVLNGTEFKIYDADVTGHTTDKAPGALVSAGKQGIEIACAGGKTLLLREIQASGGKRMSAAAYLLGHPMEV